jgi:hypothetical protein
MDQELFSRRVMYYFEQMVYNEGKERVLWKKSLLNPARIIT